MFKSPIKFGLCLLSALLIVFRVSLASHLIWTPGWFPSVTWSLFIFHCMPEDVFSLSLQFKKEAWGSSYEAGLSSLTAASCILCDWRVESWEPSCENAGPANAVQTGYSVCSVYLWLTAGLPWCNPTHQTLIWELSKSIYHSDMNGNSCTDPPFFPAGPLGASEQRFSLSRAR